MDWHSLESFFTGGGWREPSSILGALALLAAAGASFFFSSDQLAEYAGRWAIIGPAVLGVLGALGIIKRDGGGQ